MTADPMLNPEAEKALLGGLLLDPSLLDSVPDLRAADFHDLRHGVILTALHTTARDADGKVDHLAVLETLRREGNLTRVGGGPYLHECVNACPVVAQVPYYARLIRDCAARRELLIAAQRIVQAAQHPDGEQARESVADLWAHLGTLLDVDTGSETPLDVEEFGEFVGRTRAFRRQWVIPGLLAPMERVIVVAGEGAGKSTWARQVAVCLGQGLHPMNPLVRIPKRRVLMVDLENPPDLIAEQSRRLVDTARAAGGWDSENVWLWSRPAGVNLRKHSDVALLDRVMTHVRPDLMCLGPLYKASLDGSDRGEQVAQEVSAALDRLRSKHRCALWLEHHAPMSQNGMRELRPVSSGLWLRWPEFGRTLQRDPEDPSGRAFVVGKFRPDRDQGRVWPDYMTWGRTWPWESIYEQGLPAELRAEESA
jgi:hypothetical protein